MAAGFAEVMARISRIVPTELIPIREVEPISLNAARVSAPVVEVSRGMNSWNHSWHGIQDVAEQWLILQYYRLFVLPFRLNAIASEP